MHRFLSLFLAASLAPGLLTQTLDFPKEEGYGTIHVEAQLKASPEAVWHVLVRPQHWSRWMPMLSRSWFYSDEAIRAIPPQVPKKKKLFEELYEQFPEPAVVRIEQDPAWEGIAFEEYNIPWPIQDEWVVRRYQFDSRKKGEGVYKAQWGKIFDGSREIEGYWHIEPSLTLAGGTHFVYHYRVKAKTGVAMVLFKWAVRRTIDKMVHAIEKEAVDDAIRTSRS